MRNEMCAKSKMFVVNLEFHVMVCFRKIILVKQLFPVLSEIRIACIILYFR